MPSLHPRPPARPLASATALSRPFSGREIAEIEAICSRLRGELLTMLDRLPRSGRSALALARDLDLNRNICQRVTEWLNCGLEPVESLTKLPGPEGLLLFVGALVAQGGKSSRRSPLFPAALAFEKFVLSAAGSRAGLIRRVEATMRTRDGDASKDNLQSRERFFDSAVELHGQACELVFSINVLRPIPGEHEFTEGLNIHGTLGLRSMAAPVALVSSTNFTRDHAGDLAVEIRTMPLVGPDGTPATARPGGVQVLKEFSSPGLPESRVDEADGRTRTIIEPDPYGESDPIDYVRACRYWPDVHPQLQSDPRYYRSLSVRRPARRLLHDVYLHRSLAGTCVPSAAAYFWHPGLTGNPDKHWHDRLPGKTPMEVLGPGLAGAASAAWDRFAELTSRVFALAGWSPDEFVGYRCDVPYPIWAGAYYMMFDFSGGASRPG